MKRIFGAALAAAILAAPLALAAQDTRAPRFEPFASVLQYRAELDLTADQVSRIQAIQQRLQAQNEPLIAQLRAAGVAQEAERGARAPFTAEERREMRERMQSGTPAEREQLRAEMRERMGAMRSEQPERMGQRMEDMTPEQREEMRQRMGNMTPEQREEMQARMKERREAGRAQAAAGRGMRAGARGEGAGAGLHGADAPRMARVPDELRPVLQQVQANQRAAREEVHAVLTAGQWARLHELMQQRRGERGGGRSR
jgi:hypothetical protein